MMAKRWTERHEFYQKALRQLQNGLAPYPNLNELEKDGVIQRFEFTFEMAWKTLQDYFAQESGYVDVKGPRTVLKQAITDNLASDGYTWLQMLESRNELTHVYDEIVHWNKMSNEKVKTEIQQTAQPLYQRSV
jgi:nucleotidyltransferase substrate binding protein (TIGR01987 family)